jgi:hypothetical protein
MYYATCELIIFLVMAQAQVTKPRIDEILIVHGQLCPQGSYTIRVQPSGSGKSMLRVYQQGKSPTDNDHVLHYWKAKNSIG